jgi:hypothetical protein
VKRIPKAFTIGSHRFTVEYRSAKQMTEIVGFEAYGVFLPDRLKIYLERPSRKLKRSVIVQTFWHEFAHALLWTLGHKDTMNEKVVDAMGHALKQFHDTAEQ